MKAVLLLACIGVSVALQPVADSAAQDTPEDVPHDQCGVTGVLNDDESVELFALGLDGAIYHNKGFSSWTSIGGNFSSGVQAVRNMDGRVELFAIGKDEQLYHNWQQTAGENYQTEWVALGGPFSGTPSVLLNSEGNMVVFVRGKISRSLMYNHQVHNASAVYWAGWSNLGGILTSGPSSVLTAESMIHVFVRGVDKGLFEKNQVATHSGTVAWTKYDGLGGLLASHPTVPAALNPVNLLQIFVRQADRAIWYKKQKADTHESDSVVWDEWKSLGGKMSSGPSVILNNNGFLEVYSRGMNSEIFSRSQAAHDSEDFLMWESLGSSSSSTPFAMMQPNGAVHVFHLGYDKKVYRKTKTVFEGVDHQTVEWSDWQPLEGEVNFQLYYC